jgi:phosphoserine phosphatase
MKLIVFDMDGTLLNGRAILYLAKEFGFYNDAMGLIESNQPKFEISKKLAQFLKDITIHDFMEVIHQIPLMNGAIEAIEAIKKQGYKTAIITDSYDVVADYFKDKLGMNRAYSISLLIKNGIITGDLEMPLNCLSNIDCNHPSICKMEIMKGLSQEYEIPLSDMYDKRGWSWNRFRPESKGAK